jgi:UDP-2,4-diacetamido-2,4,6-trideoxy-beta-L-altropyranose hydrolase
MKPKVFVRADGNSHVGLGHLIRCMALANMLKENFYVTFVCRDIPKDTKLEIEKEKMTVKVIRDEKDFLNMIETGNIVVLDSYEFDTQYQKNIKEKNAVLVCIDDLHDKQFQADLIINHAPGISPEKYKAELSTQFALGTEYALLRTEFIEQAKQERKIESIETIFICFGGGDSKNFTENVLKIVLSFSAFKKIIVVTGSGYLHEESLKKLVQTDSRIEYYNSIPAKKMCKLMADSDLAIVPSSGILLEALACGCKIISGMTADNQKYVYSNYLKENYFTDAKDFNNESLNTAIELSLNDGQTVKKKIDGKSKERLLKLFQQLVLKNTVILKPAGESDLETTYEWAADPAVRAFSFNQNKISKEEHINWFNKKIQEKNCLYLIAETEKEKIGSIRFDIKNNEAVISYLIAPKHHGKGLGQIILTNGLEYIGKEIEQNNFYIKKIIGYVMEENVPSVKAFERLGFTKIIEADRIKYEKEVII